jgi:hypothetical protein
MGKDGDSGNNSNYLEQLIVTESAKHFMLYLQLKKPKTWPGSDRVQL